MLKKPSYVLLAIGASATIFAVAVWLPNINLIWNVLLSTDVSLSQKINLPLSLLGSITTNFSFLSATYTIAIAILAGLNVALIAYYIRERQKEFDKSGMTVGILGVFTGILGMGCAACGSIIFSSIIGTAAGTSFIALLPLRGGEFGILGVILLGISMYLLVKQISRPSVCYNG